MSNSNSVKGLNSESAIDQAGSLDASELELIREWNSTERDFAYQDSFLDLVALQVSQRPDKRAVADAVGSLSYRQLDEQSNRIAQYLIRQGLQQGEIAAVCLSRSSHCVAVLLGVLKAGGAYLPLDIIYSQTRLAYMLAVSDAKFLITETELLQQMPECAANTSCIDAIQDELRNCPAIAPERPINGDDLAYVIFTSGSTGKPKGVQVSHCAVSNFLQTMAECPGLSADDVLLAITTLSFDISVLELFLPLIVGGTTVLTTATDASEGDKLSELISTHGINVMQATPSTWRLLLASNWQGDRNLKALCGGEAFPADLKQPLLECVQSLWNMYGPTETTIWSTCGQIIADQSLITVGKPIANTQCYVVDAEGRQCGIDEEGELLIGGLGLSNGYVGQAELTEKVFVPNPFDDSPGSTVYRTGDLARWNSDGQLQIHGRIDSQVKIRGFRVELGEIETHMNELAEVKHCVASIREDRPGDQRLIAYVVQQPGRDVSMMDMRKHLQRYLPTYMIPQHLVHMDEIPTTPNGKIDRGALPSPSVSSTELQQPDTEQRDEIEAWMAATLVELIGLPTVGVNDNFFDIGGNSVIAADFIQRAKTEVDMDIPLSAMALQSISQIAKQYGAGKNLQKVGTIQASSLDQSSANDEDGLGARFGRLLKRITSR